MWAYNKADTVAQPSGGGSGVKIFTLDTNQYIGNFLAHFYSSRKVGQTFLADWIGSH